MPNLSPALRNALSRFRSWLLSLHGGYRLMPYHQDFEHGHQIPDDGPDTVVPGYPGRRGEAANYSNVPMTRDRATNIMIDYGRTSGLPVRKILNGSGYDLVIPAEWVEEQLKRASTAVGKRVR